MELFKDCIKFVITRAFFVLCFNVTLCHEVFGYDQCYYVSSTIGSNSNDGLTELTPMKDLSKVPKENAIIRLKCDDVFWGGLSGYKNCVIESYGKGAKPVICGFKVLINPEAWKQVEEELWELDLNSNNNFGGNTNVDSLNVLINNIGFIYDASKDKLYGRNRNSLDSLKNEMDFYTSINYSKEMIKEHPFRTVVVKSKNNPSEHGNLCFPMFQSGISDISNCKIIGISIVGFSAMGLVFLKNCYVDDCQIDLIGGAIQIGNSRWARYGNGVELWYNYCNNTITNCLISRTYDCATTIQANGEIKSNPQNNRFIGNRLYKCRQAFEHFMNPSDNKDVQYESSSNLRKRNRKHIPAFWKDSVF